MIKLRSATEADYLVYKKLYEDDDAYYHWLYYDLDDIAVEDSDFVIEEIPTDFTIDFDDYCDHLKWNRIFLVEEGENVIGYLSFQKSRKGIYYLAEWAMFDPTSDQIKEDILDEISNLKLPGMKSIIMNSSCQRQWFIDRGFVASISTIKIK